MRVESSNSDTYMITLILLSPLIELLKTPGRKRDVPKKMKVATAYKPKAIVNIDTDVRRSYCVVTFITDYTL